jgi:hypothetical protein
MPTKQLATAILAWTVWVISGGAHAGLIGTQMDVGYYTPDTSSPYAPAVFSPSHFTVGAGQETIGDVEGVTNILVDFSDSTLSITFDTILGSPTWNTASFNGVTFTAASFLGIGSALVDPSTSMAGFDNARVSYTDHQILLNWQGLSYVDGTTVTINFTSASAVPEPGTLALLGLGLAGLAWRRRRQ